MIHKKSIAAILTSLIIFSLGIITTFAQDNATDDTIILQQIDRRELAETENLAEQASELDENIQAEDLNISEPRLLPDNPLYFTKSIIRGAQSFFTFNPVKKAELKLKFANEKIIEAKKVIDKEIDKSDSSIEDIAAKTRLAINNFNNELDRIRTEAEKISPNDPQTEKFLKKLTDNQIKHHKILSKLEKELPSDVFENIKLSKDKVANNIAVIHSDISNPEETRKIIEEVIANQKGSDFKEIKALEVLKEVEAKVPDRAKEAIRRAQENIRENFERKFSQELSEKKRRAFGHYMEKIGGDETRQLAVMQEFEIEKIPEELRIKIQEAKERIFKKVEIRLENFKEEKQKEDFLRHLESAKTEDIRIIKELENNLDPRTIDKILEIKNRALVKMKTRFEETNTPEKQQEFFQEIEKFHDAKMLDMFKEMETIVPEDKKDFFQEMKIKALSEMQKNIGQARQIEEQEKVFRSLAGDGPEDLRAIKDFELEIKTKGFVTGPSLVSSEEMFDRMRQTHIDNVDQRLKIISDSDKLFLLKSKIDVDEEIKMEFEKIKPEFFEDIREKQERVTFRLDPQEVKKQIERARLEIRLAEEEASKYTPDELSKSNYNHLIGLAKEKIIKAEEFLQNNNYGAAFGESNAAMHIANNSLRTLKDHFLKNKIRIDNTENIRLEIKSDEFRKKILQERPQFIPEEFRWEIKEKVEPSSPEEMKKIMERMRTRQEEQKPLFENLIDENERKEEERRKHNNEQIICTTEFNPVCGMDNVTYSNKCEANKRNVAIKHQGACPVDQPFLPTKPLPPAENGSTDTNTGSGEGQSENTTICPFIDIENLKRECAAINGQIIFRQDSACGNIPYCAKPQFEDGLR